METQRVTPHAAVCFLALALPLGLTGCQESGLYDWGTYESSVQTLYLAPENASLGAQIQALQAEIHATEAQAQPNEPSRVPPGKYAHLGYLHAMQGDKLAARECFEAEKRLYPESATFVDGMLGRFR